MPLHNNNTWWLSSEWLDMGLVGMVGYWPCWNVGIWVLSECWDMGLVGMVVYVHCQID